MNTENKGGNVTNDEKERWVIIEHFDKRISPLTDKVQELSTRHAMSERRIEILENGFVKHMEAEEKVWEKITQSISDLKNTFYRVLWIGVGVGGTISVLWIAGRDILKLLVGAG